VTWSIHLPKLPKGLNSSDGMMRKHWSKRRKDQQEWDLAVAVVVAGAGPAPKPPLRLVYTRYYASHPMDPDNAAASIKQPLDALVRTGAIHDDSPDIIAELVVRQRKVPRRKDQGIVIELETL